MTKPDKKTVELSIICTDFNRNAKEVIIAILIRWLQENDMSYLILLGINCITSYSSFSYEKIAGKIVDREVKNKKLKVTKLKNKIKRLPKDKEKALNNNHEKQLKLLKAIKND